MSDTLTFEQVMQRLNQSANLEASEGMRRFGIQGAQILGISIPTLRKLAKEAGRHQDLALRLWDSKIHEARVLASMVAEPGQVTLELMEAWVKDFDSWDLCDQVCSNLFVHTPYAYRKALEWPHREEEFVRRAGFTMMAMLAVHDKRASDEAFLPFFPLITRYADDPRNFVKKAVNWALRQIGKRNRELRKLALACATELQNSPSRSAQWIAKDALRELLAKEV